ncbi:MAG: hypothetical protein FF85_01245 [alpha proteobacterium QL1]|nr:MAG: hypothetical protein FF85_01245 [alpha proteobacterium QL1]
MTYEIIIFITGFPICNPLSDPLFITNESEIKFLASINTFALTVSNLTESSSLKKVSNFLKSFLKIYFVQLILLFDFLILLFADVDL